MDEYDIDNIFSIIELVLILGVFMTLAIPIIAVVLAVLVLVGIAIYMKDRECKDAS